MKREKVKRTLLGGVGCTDGGGGGGVTVCSAVGGVGFGGTNVDTGLGVTGVAGVTVGAVGADDVYSW